jgi:multidrug efflux system outer membrane protein
MNPDVLTPIPSRIAGSSSAPPPVRARILGLCAGAAFFTGCAVGPAYTPPHTAAEATFHGAAGYDAAPGDAAWWTVFKDARLETLIVTAVTNNPDLKIATARLREARALLGESRADLFPTVRSENSYNNGLLSAAARPGFPHSVREGELYHAGFDATWEVDLFGRVRRSVEARRADLESIEAQRRDVLVTLASEVARNYFELRGTQAQLDVARRNAENQKETVRLATALRQGGRGTELDVARATTQLNLTLSTIPPLESALERSLHRIAVLLGLQPGTLPPELRAASPMPSVAAMPGIGAPADLFRRRPDIRAAERALAAATARIGVAMGDLFPRVTFNGTVALEAATLSRMTDSGGETWGFGPHLSWAAFDLARVRQRIRAADARSEAALGGYERTVLGALEETENALVDYGRQQARRDALKAAVVSATQATALARQRYQDGIADFLTVLDAERVQLQVEDALAASETRTATALIAIYKALGGGWEPFTAPPPSPSPAPPK